MIAVFAVDTSQFAEGDIFIQDCFQLGLIWLKIPKEEALAPT